ncbi:MAG TPA: MlaD family protein [Flavobacterium sp.]|nr:MlaD family protein [Flavobacterium sp.]
MNKEIQFTSKLGMFVTIGLVAFILAIYLIGKQQNLFGTTFELQSKFKNVSGLKVGNQVRFSGINVGTIDAIDIVNDSTVIVKAKIDEEVRKFIKTDAQASIGSDGLMGDKILTISPGAASNKTVEDGAMIASAKPVEMEQIMKSLQTTVDNAGEITTQLAEFSKKMNNEDGALSKLLTDAEFGNSIKNTMTNLETFSKNMNNKNNVLNKLTNDEKLGKQVDSAVGNLNETVKAAQNNFLLKGYFKKKKRADEKKARQARKQAEKTKERQAKVKAELQEIKNDSQPNH